MVGFKVRKVSFGRECILQGLRKYKKHLNNETSTSRGCWCGTKLSFFFFFFLKEVSAERQQMWGKCHNRLGPLGGMNSPTAYRSAWVSVISCNGHMHFRHLLTPSLLTLASVSAWETERGWAVWLLFSLENFFSLWLLICSTSTLGSCSVSTFLPQQC